MDRCGTVVCGLACNDDGVWRAVACIRSPGYGEDWGNVQTVCGVIVVRYLAKQRTVRRRRRFEISHNGDVAATGAASREEYVSRGRRLEYFTIGYNSLEGM